MKTQERSGAGPALDAYRTTGPSPTEARERSAPVAIAASSASDTNPPARFAHLPARTTDPPAACDGISLLSDIALEHGGVLHGGRLAWRCWGDPEKPAVLVLGGISAGRDVTASPGDERGWWTPFAGPGRAVDTDRFRVIGIDYLGGCGDSTPACELPRNADAGTAGFAADAAADALPDGPAAGEPLLSPRDQAAAIASLLGALKIRRLHAIVGASYGGMVALAFASAFPTRVARLVVLGAAHEPHPMATGLRALQRSIVRRGIATGEVRDALILARALGVTTYRTAREFASRFAPSGPALSPPSAAAATVERYLRVQGERFADRFAPESYVCLSQSIDLHRVDPARIHAPTTCIAFEPDAIAPVWQVRALAAGLRGTWSLRVLPSIYGHDAFLKEVEAITPIVADALCRVEVSR